MELEVNKIQIMSIRTSQIKKEQLQKLKALLSNPLLHTIECKLRRLKNEG